MKLTQKIIENFTTQEYLNYTKEIRKFYDDKRDKKKLRDKKRYKDQIIAEVMNEPIKTNFENTELANSIQIQSDGKECRDCLDFKKWHKFYNQSSNNDGKNYSCKDCCNEKQKLRLAIDINFRLISNLRKRLYNALKGNRKSDTTKNLVGCSIEDLKDYLQLKFKYGMSWDNYGKWHVDHIKPCSKFDFSDPEQQRICFYYTNLQPLWAIENIRKSNKF